MHTAKTICLTLLAAASAVTALAQPDVREMREQRERLLMEASELARNGHAAEAGNLLDRAEDLQRALEQREGRQPRGGSPERAEMLENGFHRLMEAAEWLDKAGFGEIADGIREHTGELRRDLERRVREDHSAGHGGPGDDHAGGDAARELAERQEDMMRQFHETRENQNRRMEEWMEHMRRERDELERGREELARHFHEALEEQNRRMNEWMDERHREREDANRQLEELRNQLREMEERHRADVERMETRLESLEGLWRQFKGLRSLLGQALNRLRETGHGEGRPRMDRPEERIMERERREGDRPDRVSPEARERERERGDEQPSARERDRGDERRSFEER